MEHIKVDDSMRQRLLQNLEKSDLMQNAADLRDDEAPDKNKTDDGSDRDKIYDDRRDGDKIYDDSRDKNKPDDDARDHGRKNGRIFDFDSGFRKNLRRFGGLAAMFAILLVGAAAVIQITGNHGNFSTSPSFDSAPAESAVMEAESEAPVESTDHDAYETSAEMAAESEETAEAADYDASETSALEKAESEAPAKTAGSAENENIILTEAESAAPSEHVGSAVKDASPSVNLDSEQVQDVQESAAAENSTVGTTEGFDADLAKREDEAGTAQLSPAPEQSITSSQAVHSDEKAAGTSAVLDDSNSVNIAAVILVVIALIILLCVVVVVFVKKNGTKKRTD
jgi:hypothetical protein